MSKESSTVITEPYLTGDELTRMLIAAVAQYIKE